MISLQEHLDAGFTEAQARALLERDLYVEDHFARMTEQMSRGFADTLTTMRAGFAAMNRRLDVIEARLRTITPN